MQDMHVVHSCLKFIPTCRLIAGMDIPASRLKSGLSSILPSMSPNSNQFDATQHPLESIATSIASATAGERRGNHTFHLTSANEGPADRSLESIVLVRGQKHLTVVAKVSGAAQGGKRADDGPYLTNNEVSRSPIRKTSLHGIVFSALTSQ